MTDYTKTTNFTSKDSLNTGDPNKVIKGSEHDTEFDNIETHMATKADKASPTFTGTVTLPNTSISGSTISGDATFSGDITFSSSMLKLAKGSDIASAAGITIPTDGNFFDVTGTTTITSMSTVGVGTVIMLQFDGVLTLTHHDTDLILPGAASITTAAGDRAIFVEYATGDWLCVVYTQAAGSGTTTHDHGYSTGWIAWAAATSYAVGDVVQASSPDGIHYFECTIAGTSHATTEPTWPTTDGGTVVDGGTLTWTARDGRGGDLTWRSFPTYDSGYYTIDNLEQEVTGAALGSSSNYPDLGISLTATRDGTANVKLGLKGDAGNATDSGNDMDVYIKVNGVETGTRRSTTRNGGVYAYFNEDIELRRGDVITVVGNDSAGAGTNYVDVTVKVQCSLDVASTLVSSPSYDAS